MIVLSRLYIFYIDLSIMASFILQFSQYIKLAPPHTFYLYTKSAVSSLTATMVLLHVKRSEESQFLHSCNVLDSVDEVLMKVDILNVTKSKVH